MQYIGPFSNKSLDIQVYQSISWAVFPNFQSNPYVLCSSPIFSVKTIYNSNYVLKKEKFASKKKAQVLNETSLARWCVYIYVY